MKETALSTAHPTHGVRRGMVFLPCACAQSVRTLLVNEIPLATPNPCSRILKSRISSLTPFRFAMPLRFSYSYSALAVLVLVLDDRETSTTSRTPVVDLAKDPRKPVVDLAKDPERRLRDQSLSAFRVAQQDSTPKGMV